MSEEKLMHMWPRAGLSDKENCKILLFHLTEAWTALANAEMDIARLDPGNSGYYAARRDNCKKAVRAFEEINRMSARDRQWQGVKDWMEEA